MNEDSLRRIAEALERIADLLEQRDVPKSGGHVFEDEPVRPSPSWLTEANAASLTEELFAFVDQEQSDSDRTWLDHDVVAAFWESKGLEERYDLPSKHERLLEKIEAAVTKQREAREKEQLTQEEASIPRLIASCVQWATERQIKRLNQADVEALLKPDLPEIRHTTVRSVWQQVNLELKACGQA